MKKILLFFIIFSLSWAALAQEQTLILRRVYFSPLTVQGAPPDAVFLEFPAILAARLTSLEPIITTSTPEEAHSRVMTALEITGPEETRLVVRLFEKESLLRSCAEIFNAQFPAQKKLKDFIEATALDFKSLMGKVTPEKRTFTIIQDEETKQKVADIEFSERMAAINEMEFLAGGAAKQLTFDAAPGLNIGLILQAAASYTWYFDKLTGLTFQVLFERSDLMSFSGHLSGTAFIPEKSVNTFILPGIGLTLRSLGRLSTSFSVILHGGAVNVEAAEFLSIPGLPPGASLWFFFPALSFKLTLCLNLTPYFSLRLQTGFLLNPLALTALLLNLETGYRTQSALLQYQLISLGTAIKF